MRGTIISRVGKDGKKQWGYSFFAGRDQAGKRVQRVKRGFSKKAEAEKALREALANSGKSPVTTEDSNRTLNEVFDEWMLKHVRRECTPRTVEAYLEQGRYVLRKLGVDHSRRSRATSWRI